MGRKKNVKLLKKDSQVDLLRFIESFCEEHGYGPTYREMQEACGYKWQFDITKDLKVLYGQGLIETDHPGSPRAIRPKK